MTLKEAVSLLDFSYNFPDRRQKWADLGCGSGLFTYALAGLLPEYSTVYAVDTDRTALKGIGNEFGNISIKKINLDFLSTDLPDNLNGILMANSLHFVKDKLSLIRKLQRFMTSNAFFLIVEYDTEISNRWVPYPVSFNKLEGLFKSAGCSIPEKINTKPSIYRRENLYSAFIRCQNHCLPVIM